MVCSSIVKSRDIKNRLITFKVESYDSDSILQKHQIDSPINHNPFKLLHKTTKCKKVKYACYKIINNISFPKRNLFRAKLADTDKCSFCNLPEDEIHLLFSCKAINDIWKQLTSFFESQYAIKTHISYESQIVGIVSNSQCSHQPL